MELPIAKLIEAAYTDTPMPSITLTFDRDMSEALSAAAQTAYGHSWGFTVAPNGLRTPLLGNVEYAGPDVTFELDGAMAANSHMLIERQNVLIGEDGMGNQANATVAVRDLI